MSASSFRAEPAAVRADLDTLMIDIPLMILQAYRIPCTRRKFILKPTGNLMEFRLRGNLLNFRD